MSKSKVGFISICLAGCLTFSPVGAGAAYAAASSWTAQRDIAADKSFTCTVSRQYNGFFNFALAGRSDGRTSLTFTFKDRSFSKGSQVPVRLYTAAGASETFDVTALSATRITVTLGRDSVILPALQGQDVLYADIGSRFRAVNVYSLSPGMEKLAACKALPLDDPGTGILSPPPKPAAPRPSLVRVPAAAPDIAAQAPSAQPTAAQQPAAQPVQRPDSGGMTSRIASLMQETEPAPQPSADLLAPAPAPSAQTGGLAPTGDPFNDRIRNMVQELSGTAPAPQPQPLLEPAQEETGTLLPVEGAAQPPRQPAPVQAAPVQAAPAATSPAPVEAAPLQPIQQQPPAAAPAPAQTAAPAPTPAPAPVVAAVPQPQAAPAPVVPPVTAQPPAPQPPVVEEQPKEIVWAHKRIVPDPPEFILKRQKEQELESEPGVMLAETRDAVHKPLSMPPDLRNKEQLEEELAAAAAPEENLTGPDGSIKTPDMPDMQAEVNTLEPTPPPAKDELSMDDILNEPLKPTARSDQEPVFEEQKLPTPREPARPSDFVQELEADTTLLAQAQKIDEATLTAENTNMEMVGSLLEKMRLLEIEKESLRKELASYQTGPVSDIARVESQARKIYALKTRLERLGNENATLQSELKFSKDKVANLEQAITDLQVQADEAASLREQVNTLTEQNDALRTKLSELEKEAQDARSMRDEDRRRLDELRDIIGSMSGKLDTLTGTGDAPDNNNGGDNTDGGAQDGGADMTGQDSTGQDSTGDMPPMPGGNNDQGTDIPTIDPNEFKDFIKTDE